MKLMIILMLMIRKTNKTVPESLFLAFPYEILIRSGLIIHEKQRGVDSKRFDDGIAAINYGKME